MENIQKSVSREFLIDGIATQILGTLFDVTMDHCIQQCNYVKSCMFVNYLYITHVCVLIQHLNPSIAPTVALSPRHVSADLSGSKSLIDPCQHCFYNETCHNNDCIIEYCPAPTAPSGVELYGNLYTTGSTLMYRCHGSTDPAHRSYSTCLENGTWTDHNLSELQPTTFETGTLTSGIPVTFVVIEKDSTKAESVVYCTSICARLLMITTYEKFLYFRDVMNRDGSHDYWVDVQRADYSSPWVTSTGEILPQGDDQLFWYESDLKCARADHRGGYRWNGLFCTETYWFICEK